MISGTWQSPKGQVRAAVAHAIKTGWRHIDAAYVYGNEAEVGEGIKEGLAATGISRSDLFIVTKLWCTYHTKVEQNLDKSLKLLDLDYVDLYLMHWPIAMNPDGNDEKFPKLPDGSRDLIRDRSHVDTYKDMEKLLQTEKTKAIGVANYSKRYLEELLSKVDVVSCGKSDRKPPAPPSARDCGPVPGERHPHHSIQSSRQYWQSAYEGPPRSQAGGAERSHTRLHPSQLSCRQRQLGPGQISHALPHRREQEHR